MFIMLYFIEKNKYMFFLVIVDLKYVMLKD